MKALLQNGSIAIVIALFISSCSSKGPAEARYIPKNSSLVFVVEPGIMKEKLQKGGISIDTLVHQIFSSDSIDQKDKATFDAFRNEAGINWDNRLFFFLSQQGNLNDGQSTAMNLLGSLKDAKKFEAFLKNQGKLKEKPVTKGNGYNYILPENGTMVSWTSDHIILTVYTHYKKPVFDTVTFEYKTDPPANTEEKLKKEVEKYYTQKKDESIASVDMFANMFKEKADGYAFSSSNASASVLSMLPLNLPKLDELIKDNYSVSSLNFEEGKVVVKSLSYTNPLISSVLKKYAGPKVNTDMLTYYPSDNINGFLLASFNPEIFKGFVQQLEMEGLMKTALEKSGINSDDIFKMLKGDIAVVVSDIGMAQSDPLDRKDEKSLVRRRPVGKMLLTAPVGDKASFAKLMDKAVELGYFKKESNKYTGGGALNILGIFVHADDQNIIIASDSLTYAQYITKAKKANIKKEVLEQISNQSTAAYFDITATLNMLFKGNESNGYNKSIQKAKEVFKDMIVTTDNFNGKSVDGKFEIRLNNAKQNSLVTLTSLFTNIAVDMRMASRLSDYDTHFPFGTPAVIRTN